MFGAVVGAATGGADEVRWFTGLTCVWWLAANGFPTNPGFRLEHPANMQALTVNATAADDFVGEKTFIVQLCFVYVFSYLYLSD